MEVGGAQPEAVQWHVGVTIGFAEVRELPGVPLPERIHLRRKFGRKGIDALWVGANLRQGGDNADLRRAHVVTCRALGLIDRPAGLHSPTVNVVGWKLRRPQ